LSNSPWRALPILTLPSYSQTLADQLTGLGLADVATVHRNLTTAELYEHAIRRNEGTIAQDGQLVVDTGKFTGRSPRDKFFVREPGSEQHIDWGRQQAFSAASFDTLFKRVAKYLGGREIYTLDCYVGADPRYQLPIRVISELAWHNLFARDLFIVPAKSDEAFEPQFTVIDVGSFQADPDIDGTRSSTFCILNFAKRINLIGGTLYAGEIKKSVFTIMNYLMPLRGVLPMHCSANRGANGDVAIFFGLSGTGKTTLSSDSSRPLIGDDEHGWSDNGVFNFEGGCYAKCIRLSEKNEPEIWAASHRFGTVLENVIMDPATRKLDLDSDAKTENTRAAYPASFIPNVVPSLQGEVPRTIVMLTADAFGVLPPIARLSKEQAMYHFLSGYTAIIAGTEREVTEPTATFSTCFASPFLVQHPTVYAKLLGDRIDKHEATCWLVNTGWTGGPPGIGHRFAIPHTRAMVNAVIDGKLAGAKFRREPFFGLEVPVDVPGVPGDVLDPKKAWSDPAAYDAEAKKLATLFAENFKKYEKDAGPAVNAIAIRP